MKNLINLFRNFGNKRKSLDNKLLKKFTNQIYNGDSLSSSEALNNLEKGIIEIIYPNGQHSSDGLLITKNGYFITPHHCLKDGKKRFIKTYSNKIYPIKKLCSFSKKYDVALAKTNLSDNRNIFEYKISLENPRRDSALILIIKRDDKLIIKNCFVNNENFGISIYKDSDKEIQCCSANFFQSNLKSKEGDSGGVLADYDGKLFGILTSIDKKRKETNSINFFKVIECVETYRVSLMK